MEVNRLCVISLEIEQHFKFSYNLGVSAVLKGNMGWTKGEQSTKKTKKFSLKPNETKQNRKVRNQTLCAFPYWCDGTRSCSKYCSQNRRVWSLLVTHWDYFVVNAKNWDNSTWRSISQSTSISKKNHNFPSNFEPSSDVKLFHITKVLDSTSCCSMKPLSAVVLSKLCVNVDKLKTQTPRIVCTAPSEVSSDLSFKLCSKISEILKIAELKFSGRSLHSNSCSVVYAI